jgi:asparagine synthase (glutamine-hydrolysing)
MCGIFTLLNNDHVFTFENIEKEFMKGNKRGPEFSKLEKVSIECYFGFHRLAINGLNSESNQPIVIQDVSIICNGEIYNYKELVELMGIKMKTDSDCEIIIHLYLKYGIEQTLQLLDGVFAFVLCDNVSSKGESKLIVARDPYGVRPLYQLRPILEKHDYLFGFASEIKCLNEFYNVLHETHELVQFEPGTYSIFTQPYRVIPKWILQIKNKQYHSFGFNSIMFSDKKNDLTNIISEIQYYFINSIKKRVLVTERPIACLLSGGLDSSLVTALVNEIYKEKNPGVPLETYSIGLVDSEDLKYARIVSKYLGTKHTEIILTEEDFFKAIPEVIYAIESYDTTTVRASIGNYLVAKYISENSSAKVIFNGDGSDELSGGYLYMGEAPDSLEFDCECRRLLKDIHIFDVLRSDKSISSNGLEPRTPFLDRSFVQYYLSIGPSIRFHKENGVCEKFLLRSAFSEDNFLNSMGLPLLPDSILWRKKEAFSDGVSKKTRSLFQIIHDFLDSDTELKNNIIERTKYIKNNCNSLTFPDTLEKKYYRALFDEFYPRTHGIIPYFWMPRYISATDASARTLTIYNNNT